tara:strand:+ start:1230 stop:1472 length:243 start_codon:yes stop_codon:yes gene_type:complete
MRLADEQVEEFRKICAANGISMSMAEAHEEAFMLLSLCQLLARPLQSEVAEHERAMHAEKARAFSSPRNLNEPPIAHPPL